ncbi:MAG: POTRA domain-containing protein [Lysobacteraceae bacterium]
MDRWRRHGLAGATALAALLLTAPPAAASPGPAPTVSRIEFQGNERTREAVLLREMALAPGEPADPDRLRASAQAIRDLGLFREVEVDTRPDGDGVAVVVRVREKRYLLVIPRGDLDDALDFSIGVQLKRDNLFGRNHSLDVFAETGRYDADRLRQSEDRYRIRYDAPYLWNGTTGLVMSLEHADRLAPAEAGEFREKIDRSQLLVTHDFRQTRPRRGWIGSAGLFWQDQDTRGEDAPVPDGQATAAVVGAVYSDVRFNVYSETGRRFDARLEVARDGWASDYGYRRVELRHIDRFAIGDIEHQNLNLLAAAGWMGGGPGRVDAFDLGGASRLRGYESDYIQGQRYAYVGAEYLRPLFGRNWLRGLVVAEVGATGNSVEGARAGGPYASIGVGARIRLTWFVNADLEFGVAQPLRGGDGPRLFLRGL